MKSLAVVASAIFLGACGPSVWISGTVKAPPGPGCAASAIELRQVVGANVELECPRANAKSTTTTSERGQFFFVGQEAFPLDCKLRVTQAGFAAREYRVGDVCAHGTATGCEQATVAVDFGTEAAR